jgi:hypothetical protein
MHCPINDKAFTCQKRGKVRGLMFDATDLTWRLSDCKVNKAKGSVESALSKEVFFFERVAVGCLNDI